MTAEVTAAGTDPAAAGPDAAGPLLELDQLMVSYRARRGPRDRRLIRAVDGVSFSVGTGEIVALVGESGCGKTSIVRAVARLEEAAGGRVLFRGHDVAHVRGPALRQLRREIQVVFQDPFESLDPRLTVYDTVAESLLIHRLGATAAARRDLVHDALEQVGLHPAAQIARRYPHQLSGGQRQRLVIAGAMVFGPDLLIADEPVSMLDVSLRAGILRLMLDLRADRGVSILFVTHDLSLAWLIADRIAVVYLGRIVELGRADEVIQAPLHPYTRALVSVIPVPEAGAARERILLRGEAPSASRIPPGCRFHPRCPLYQRLGRPDRCTTDDPALTSPDLTSTDMTSIDMTSIDMTTADPEDPARSSGGHVVACHFAKEMP
jgi:oligopeptide/dipeptide ABC transporter ATP-binding protein